MQTGQLETMRGGLNDKQKKTIEYGVGALVGGLTRFVFGREVVDASRLAFSEPPEAFPDHLAVTVAEPEDEAEPNRAFAALDDAAKATSNWVLTAADNAARAFRSIDLDGDGIPDEARALTAVKGLGAAVAGATSNATQVFRSIDLDGDGVPDEAQAVTALKGVGQGFTSVFKRTPKRGEGEPDRGGIEGAEGE